MYNGSTHRGTDFQITCVMRDHKFYGQYRPFSGRKSRLFIYICWYYSSLKKQANRLSLESKWGIQRWEENLFLTEEFYVYECDLFKRMQLRGFEIKHNSIRSE